jgi:hypothetical protein
MKSELLLCALVFAQASTARADVDEWENILKAIKEQRATIKTGYFTGIGISESFIESEKKWVKGVLKLRLHFDLPAKKIRYEREAPAFALPDYTAHKGGILIRTAEKSVRRDLSTDKVQVGNSDGLFSIYLHPFDVRALGLAFYADYARGDSFEEIWKNYTMFKDNQITSREDGRVTVVTTMSPATRRTMTTDTKRGYWPTRLVVESRKRDGDGKLIWRSPPEVISEVSVEKYQGIWVPVKYSVESATRKDRFELKWHMLNQSHDAGVFTAEGIDLVGERSSDP